MAAPASGPAGGFLTGWKGLFLLLLGAGVVGMLVWTGLEGRVNTFLELKSADRARLGRENDFGRALYRNCITNSSTFGDGDWQAAFEVPGQEEPVTSVSLTDLPTLVALGNVYAGDNDTAPANYMNRPEVACFAVCRTQLGDDCRIFTYDGLTLDSCRFLKPDEDVPREVKKSFEQEPDFYVYNATCMHDVRVAFLQQFDEERVDLTRPAQGPLPSDRLTYQPYRNSLDASLRFLRAQWAGAFDGASMGQAVPNQLIDASVQPDPGATWKPPGFVGACGLEDGFQGRGGVGSFASGDHIVSTFGVAHELAELSLGRLWWDFVFDSDDSGVTKGWVQDEIVHQGVFLVMASRAASDADDSDGGILVGVGDQVNATDSSLLAYASFSAANFALLVGDPEFPTGQPTTVDPVCTYSTPEQPAADVAAAAAAALSMGHPAVARFTNEGNLNISGSMLAEAERLLEYSMTAAPINGTLGVDVHSAGTPGTFGASQLFTVDRAEQVHAHQFWASCSLWQQTGNEKYWNQTLELYNQTILGGEQLVYFPVLNYRNPAWYGVMCMAQSAPSYSGIEAREDIGLNETLLTQLFLDFKAFAPGSRAQAEQLIWSEFVFNWVTSQGPTILRLPDTNFRYRNITSASGEPVEGMLRDSASAALLALMYADLPGVDEDRRFAARCFAKQQVDFLMGDNPSAFSYQVNLAFEGSSSPRDVWHKDAACDPASVRKEHYSLVFKEKKANATGPNAEFPRECDYLTFAGGQFGQDPKASNTYRPNDYYLTGALVSWLDPAGPGAGYVDNKFLDETDASGNKVPNEQSRVRIDYNSALAGATAGVAALPASFYDRTCPSAEEMELVELDQT